MDVRYLVIILFILYSCTPAPTVSQGNLSSSETTGGTTGGQTGGVTPTPTGELNWNYLGQTTSTITLNVSNLINAYITGSKVEGYLANSSNSIGVDYCLVSSFVIGGVASELRSRIVPISYYDFKLKKTVRSFRVDFQDITNSTSICSPTTKILNSNGEYIIDPTTPPVNKRFYDADAICENCTSIVSATKVNLFKVASSGGSTVLHEVPSNLINVKFLSLQIDPNYSVVGDAGTCSNSECRSRGFDCCLQNQCVKDGGEKPTARTLYSSLFLTAEEEKKTNPLAYLNYPQLYYICGTSVPVTPTPPPDQSYDEAFAILKKDYQCIEYLKSKSSQTPFHTEVLTTNYAPTTDCLTSEDDEDKQFHYINVLKRLYTTCGCNRTDIESMVNNCPNYEYVVTTRDASGPVRIDCYTPPGNTPTIPQVQFASVSGRSAPHRFFDKNGVERNPSDGVEQEGDSFSYLDDGKVLPVIEEFSMNAILGQMSIHLDKALPAKTVNVELDQVYLISTTSGYYTPCPSCAKDSWLNSLTAFPSSSTGVGLQAVGHTTERDAVSTNTSGGNYEDTIFGRACWLPPTMIPFSHRPGGSAKTQREKRLRAQAALFANGYQRDWFGFNKGALIGSFDGVTWFAIGKGRIVRSTSTKLFLAINAPFADLANPNIHAVRVAAYDGITQAAQVDYDPQYHQYHPLQNEAGNCQKYHMCDTDTDCITNLGWEYACADVKDITTKWPSFNSNGNEEVNPDDLPKTLDQILQQKAFPSASTKRCVYRGAGAVCHSNAGGFSSSDLNKRKMLTCAPNFYCASLSSSSHNNKIARYAAPLEEIPISRNHFFGKDANILGRPLDYQANQSLADDIQTTIRENLSTIDSSFNSRSGLCQPGKALPTLADQATLQNPFEQHKGADPFKRTDYISQIGSCNSGLFALTRHTSCPVIGSDGNYEIFSSTSLPADFTKKSTIQNACGLESLSSTANLNSTTDALSAVSPFQSIEAKPLHSQIVIEPTLVRDACYRRAGSVCHTDLDCSPNKFHASKIDLFGSDYFGNNAEKSYWSEYLVCGQTDPKPRPSNATDFRNYQINENRCCREVGQNLTTYTADIPLSTAPGQYDPHTVGLRMSISPSLSPQHQKRYSRFATVSNIGTSSRPVLSAYQERTGGSLTANTSYSAGTNVMSPNQWKSLTEANSNSCCGGGWIRKFSDGSNDWTRRDRLLLDVTNFKCINSRTPLITHPEDVANRYASIAEVTSFVGLDFGDYCKDSTNTNGACAQFTIPDSALDVLPDSIIGNFDTSIEVNTINPSFSPSSNPDYYFVPRSADNDSAVFVDYNNTSTTARRNINLKLPSYVESKNFNNRFAANTLEIKIILENENESSALVCKKDTSFIPTSSRTTPGTGQCIDPTDCCIYNFNSTTRILSVALTTQTAQTAKYDKKKVGVYFTTPTPGFGQEFRRSKPGTSAYYLKRLGKLELSGIPQITFEALTCNDNNNRIVPGIFSSSIKFLLNDNSVETTETNTFSNTDFSFKHSYLARDSSGNNVVASNKYFTNKHGLQHEAVFSENEFKCCSPLGRSVTSASKCCSGYVTGTDSSGGGICSLPKGTDLMVYFNRFVSNEGQDPNLPGGGLTEEDFDTLTGEPLLKSSVNDKIRSLGQFYCESGKVRQGGLFGLFEPEPQGTQTDLTSRIYNMTDSSRDVGLLSNAGQTVVTGYPAFTEGYRWNHHLYCE